MLILLTLFFLGGHPGFAVPADMEEEENRHPPVREDPARDGEKPAAELSLDADWDQSGAFCAGQVIILVMAAFVFHVSVKQLNCFLIVVGKCSACWGTLTCVIELMGMGNSHCVRMGLALLGGLFCLVHSGDAN